MITQFAYRIQHHPKLSPPRLARKLRFVTPPPRTWSQSTPPPQEEWSVTHHSSDFLLYTLLDGLRGVEHRWNSCTHSSHIMCTCFIRCVFISLPLSSTYFHVALCIAGCPRLPSDIPWVSISTLYVYRLDVYRCPLCLLRVGYQNCMNTNGYVLVSLSSSSSCMLGKCSTDWRPDTISRSYE